MIYKGMVVCKSKYWTLEKIRMYQDQSAGIFKGIFLGKVLTFLNIKEFLINKKYTLLSRKSVQINYFN